MTNIDYMGNANPYVFELAAKAIFQHSEELQRFVYVVASLADPTWKWDAEPGQAAALGLSGDRLELAETVERIVAEMRRLHEEGID